MYIYYYITYILKLFIYVYDDKLNSIINNENTSFPMGPNIESEKERSIIPVLMINNDIINHLSTWKSILTTTTSTNSNNHNIRNNNINSNQINNNNDTIDINNNGNNLINNNDSIVNQCNNSNTSSCDINYQNNSSFIIARLIIKHGMYII